MMFTINKVFIDSSILIEYIKQNKVDLLDELTKQSSLSLFINSIVISEFTFHLIALKGNKSPLTLKVSKAISSIISNNNIQDSLKRFELIDIYSGIIGSYLELIKTYNLLPNDALILATCKAHNIKAIASFDSDFETPCKNENIVLLKSVNDLKLLQ